MQIINCNFHDGISSKSYKITVKISDDGITISDQTFWKFSDIIILEKPTEDRPAILSSKNNLDARLYINEVLFFNKIRKNVSKFNINKKELVKLLQESSVLILTFIALAVVIPIIFGFISSKISDQQLQELGNVLTKKITQEGKNICTNSTGNSELQKLINKISPNSGYKVYVVKEKTTNALALPDGTIIIFSQLLDKLSSPNELVVILAHEIGHIKKQHHKKLFAINILTSNMIGNYTKAISYVLNLRYSRADETEADDFAYDFATKNKIDPQSFIAVFNSFKEEKILDGKILGYISTHPALDDRISSITEKITHQKIHSENFISKNSWQKIKNICHS